MVNVARLSDIEEVSNLEDLGRDIVLASYIDFYRTLSQLMYKIQSLPARHRDQIQPHELGMVNRVFEILLLLKVSS